MNQDQSPSASPPPAAELPTALELAMLAAAIDPGACGAGRFREALLLAMALLDESATLREEKTAKSAEEWRALLSAELQIGNKGAKLYMERAARKILREPETTLTLALSDHEEDTLRPYLGEHCNFEGKGNESGRKAWGSIRTVRDNFRKMFVDEANKANLASVKKSPLPDGPWRDGEREFEEYLESHKVLKNGKPAGYALPLSLVDGFMEWRRELRAQKIGIRELRPLTRQEVFGKPVKTTFPKKGR